MEKSKKSILIGGTVILLVTLILLGLTYAYYRTRIVENTAEKSVSVTSEKLEVAYSDNNSMFTATEVRPGYDNEDEPKEFTITNTGDTTVDYGIILDNVANGFNKGTSSRGRYNDWSYELVNKETNETIANGDITSDLVQVMISTVSIDPKDEQTFQLIIRYKELTDIDQSDDMGQKLSFRINISDSNIAKKRQTAVNAYQAYLLGINSGTISETTTATQYVRSELDEADINSADVAVYNDKVIIGSGAYALDAGIEIGDCIEYNSPTEIKEGANDNKCEWRVLNIGDDGNLQILSHDADHIKVSSYDTGVKELNEASKKYVDGIIGINARSITVEDINKITGYNPVNVGVYDSDQTGIGTIYGKDTLREYLNEVTFTQSSSGLTATGSNGISSSSNSTTYRPYLSSTVLANGESDIVIRDYYSYYPETLTTETYTDGNQVIGISNTSKAWDMLFSPIIHPEEPTNFYWLANSYIDAKPTLAHWGLRTVGQGRVTGAALWDSTYGNRNEYYYFLRVVVTIQNIEGMSFEKTSYQSHGNDNFIINT